MAYEHERRDGRPLDSARCRESVHDGGTWPSFHQCKRKAIVDGKWCKQHSLEGQEARLKKSNEAFRAQMANSPSVRIKKLKAEIKRLAAENTELRGQVKAKLAELAELENGS